MFGWRPWIIYLPLSFFLIGCSDNTVGVRTSPNTSDRGIRGPNLLPFPTLEAAKQYRAEQRKADIAMSKILAKLHATPNSDERSSLKSEWVKLDVEISKARSAEAIREKAVKISNLNAKVAAPGAPADAPEKNEVEYLREEYLIALGSQAEAMLQLRRLVRDVRPFLESMSESELASWGSSANYVDAFDVNYGFIRSSVRMAGSLEDMAEIARQLNAADATKHQNHVEKMTDIRTRLVPATPGAKEDQGKNE